MDYPRGQTPLCISHIIHSSFFRVMVDSGNRFHPEVEDRVIICLNFPTLKRRSDHESSNGKQAVDETAIRLQRGKDGGLTLCLKQLLSVIIHEIALNILNSGNSSNHMCHMYIEGTMMAWAQARRMENTDVAISVWREMQITILNANFS